MTRRMQMRARRADDMVELLVRVMHPMETGLRKDKATGKKIPAHFIRKMSVIHNGRLVMVADLGIAVSRNPIMGFGLKDASNGDQVKVDWQDNKGETGSMSLTLSL